MSCGNVLLVVVCVEVGRALLALYHPDQPLSPTTLAFSQETDAEEWLGHISSGGWVNGAILYLAYLFPGY